MTTDPIFGQRTIQILKTIHDQGSLQIPLGEDESPIFLLKKLEYITLKEGTIDTYICTEQGAIRAGQWAGLL